MDTTQLEHVQSFRAATMRDALEAVRTSLGQDAVIVETRRVRETTPRRGWRQGEAIDLFEVTAGLEPIPDSRPVPAEDWIEDSLRHEQSPIPKSHLHRETEDFAIDRPTLASDHDELRTTTQPQTPVQESTKSPAFVEATESRTAEVQPEAHASRHPIDYDVDEKPLKDRLAAIEQAIRSLTRDRRGHGPIIDRLANRGIPVALARYIVQEAASDDPMVPPSVDDLVHATAQLIRSEPAPDVRPGEQRRIALIGPTGVGKTTTIAKLAAGYRLRNKLSVGLITVDDYRVAAADQLRTYAELMDCPIRVVSDDDAMQHAVSDLRACDVILIDTAGLGRPEAKELSVLDRRLALAGVQDRYFVVSVCNTLASTNVAYKRYQPLRPSAAIYTKLDETPEPGIVVGIASEVPLPVRYVTIGQEVPRDLEVADSLQLAREIVV